MSSAGSDVEIQEHNVTGNDYSRREHLCYRMADSAYVPEPDEPSLPALRGLHWPADVVERVYYGNARELLGTSS
jgi:hypothetical protein